MDAKYKYREFMAQRRGTHAQIYANRTKKKN